LTVSQFSFGFAVVTHQLGGRPGQPSDPQTLNAWLENNNGYMCEDGDCNNLILDMINKVSGGRLLFVSELEKQSIPDIQVCWGCVVLLGRWVWLRLCVVLAEDRRVWRWGRRFTLVRFRVFARWFTGSFCCVRGCYCVFSSPDRSSRPSQPPFCVVDGLGQQRGTVHRPRPELSCHGALAPVLFHL
jgi:hypothetical protein